MTEMTKQLLRPQLLHYINEGDTDKPLLTIFLRRNVEPNDEDLLPSPRKVSRR
jgi:hypothetical protein